MCVNVHESLNRLPACLYVIPKTPNGRLDLECRKRKKRRQPKQPLPPHGNPSISTGPLSLESGLILPPQDPIAITSLLLIHPCIHPSFLTYLLLYLPTSQYTSSSPSFLPSFLPSLLPSLLPSFIHLLIYLLCHKKFRSPSHSSDCW